MVIFEYPVPKALNGKAVSCDDLKSHKLRFLALRFDLGTFRGNRSYWKQKGMPACIISLELLPTT